MGLRGEEGREGEEERSGGFHLNRQPHRPHFVEIMSTDPPGFLSTQLSICYWVWDPDKKRGRIWLGYEAVELGHRGPSAVAGLGRSAAWRVRQGSLDGARSASYDKVRSREGTMNTGGERCVCLVAYRIGLRDT